MEYFLGPIRRFADFSGRSRRQEYWMFTLCLVIIHVVLGVADRVVGLTIHAGPGADVGILGSLFTLAVLIPSLSVAVRRLHDTGRSGWWLLIVLVPCIGVLALLFFYVQESQPGPNAYGPNPKGA